MGGGGARAVEGYAVRVGTWLGAERVHFGSVVMSAPEVSSGMRCNFN